MVNIVQTRFAQQIRARVWTGVAMGRWAFALLAAGLALQPAATESSARNAVVLEDRRALGLHRSLLQTPTPIDGDGRWREVFPFLNIVNL